MKTTKHIACEQKNAYANIDIKNFQAFFFLNAVLS